MTPEAFGGCDNMMQGAGLEHPVLGKLVDIPCHINEEGNAVVSVWRPTPAEAALLVGGGVIILTVAGQSHPPLSLTVERSKVVNAGMARA